MPTPTVGSAILQWVGSAPETTYGTPIATPTTFFPADTPVWTSPTENLTDKNLRGSMAVEFQQVKGLRYDQVTFKTALYLDSCFPILRAALGYPDVVTGSGDPYTHKTSLQSGNNGQPASSTIFFYDAQGKCWQMAGAQIASVKLTLNTGALSMMEVTYIGLPAIPITPPSNTPTTAKPMPSWNTVFTLAGTTYSTWSQLVIDIKRNTKMVPTITGTQTPVQIWAGGCTVSGTIDALYQGSADPNLTANLLNTQQALVAKVSPVGDATHYIQVQMTVVAFDDSKVAGASDWMTISSPIKALANSTDVAGGGNLSPMLVTLLSPVSTVI